VLTKMVAWKKKSLLLLLLLGHTRKIGIQKIFRLS